MPPLNSLNENGHWIITIPDRNEARLDSNGSSEQYQTDFFPQNGYFHSLIFVNLWDHMWRCFLGLSCESSLRFFFCPH